MPTIAAISDFVDGSEIEIANKSDSNVGAGITWFINKYEPVYLRELFGSDFAALFVSGLATLPPDARMIALLTPNGYDLKTAIDSFIYYWYMRKQDTQTTGVGTVKTNNQNSTVNSSRDKVFRAWFEMVHISFQVLKYLKDNAATYPEYKLPFWYNSFWCLWGNWHFAIDFFYSEVFYELLRRRLMPDIFVPLSRL